MRYVDFVKLYQKPMITFSLNAPKFPKLSSLPNNSFTDSENNVSLNFHTLATHYDMIGERLNEILSIYKHVFGKYEGHYTV